MDTSSSFLTNETVKNIVIGVALLNVIGYIVIGNVDAVSYFIILSILIWFFSKNLIIVLGLPILFANLFVIINQKMVTNS